MIQISMVSYCVLRAMLACVSNQVLLRQRRGVQWGQGVWDQSNNSMGAGKDFAHSLLFDLAGVYCIKLVCVLLRVCIDEETRQTEACELV